MIPHRLALSRASGLLVGAVLLAVLAGCDSKQSPSSYVARVGDQYLQETDVNRMLKGMGPVPDSTEARQQVIEQWVERSLLLREAERLNLSQDAEVQRLLRKRRRNTLVGAMTNRIHENMDQSPTDEEVRTYFERHQDQLTLREPYVRVRHLTTTTIDSARAARTALAAASASEADSVWTRLSQQYAQNPTRSQQLADRFLPESRLFAQLPYVRDELATLQEGETAPVIEANNRFHVLELMRRVPEGAEPQLQWVEAEIRRRLRVRRRKQMHAREVQRLRNRAKADGLIETP
ncbi:MAG: peptidylprolyl isomerase [Salinivenus sp.]